MYLKNDLLSQRKNNALQWTKRYLENRLFQVQVGKSMSAPVTINYSVPQGSILGPVLFTCYAATLDDFVEERSAYLSGYADDHALMDSFRPGDGNSERECLLSLEQTITSVREWMVLNHLKMNDSKTEYIIFENSFQRQKCVSNIIHVLCLPKIQLYILVPY